MSLTACGSAYDQMWTCQSILIRCTHPAYIHPIRYSVFLVYCTISAPQTTNGPDVPFALTPSTRNNSRRSSGLMKTTLVESHTQSHLHHRLWPILLPFPPLVKDRHYVCG